LFSRSGEYEYKTAMPRLSGRGTTKHEKQAQKTPKPIFVLKIKEALMKKWIAGLTGFVFLMGSGLLIPQVWAKDTSPLAGAMLADKKKKESKEGEEKGDALKIKEDALKIKEDALQQKEAQLMKKEEELKKKEEELKAREQRMKKRTPPTRVPAKPAATPQAGTPLTPAPAPAAPQAPAGPQPGTQK
jgi:hypothetical protein